MPFALVGCKFNDNVPDLVRKPDKTIIVLEFRHPYWFISCVSFRWIHTFAYYVVLLIILLPRVFTSLPHTLSLQAFQLNFRVSHASSSSSTLISVSSLHWRQCNDCEAFIQSFSPAWLAVCPLRSTNLAQDTLPLFCISFLLEWNRISFVACLFVIRRS
jgi:hypothetical protein